MDRVVETSDGYDCIVAERRFGTWRSKVEAVAGMFVERRRAAGQLESRITDHEADAEIERQRTSSP